MSKATEGEAGARGPGPPGFSREKEDQSDGGRGRGKERGEKRGEKGDRGGGKGERGGERGCVVCMFLYCWMILTVELSIAQVCELSILQSALAWLVIAGNGCEPEAREHFENTSTNT